LEPFCFSDRGPVRGPQNEQPRLMEITGRGFLKKQVPSWDAALRNTNTAPRYENMTGKPQLIGSCAVSLGGQAPAGGAAGFAGADRPGHRGPQPEPIPASLSGLAIGLSSSGGGQFDLAAGQLDACQVSPGSAPKGRRLPFTVVMLRLLLSTARTAARKN
jgi:hypothetical protein